MNSRTPRIRRTSQWLARGIHGELVKPFEARLETRDRKNAWSMKDVEAPLPGYSPSSCSAAASVASRSMRCFMRCTTDLPMPISSAISRTVMPVARRAGKRSRQFVIAGSTRALIPSAP
jgi:hypothetical protein